MASHGRSLERRAHKVKITGIHANGKVDVEEVYLFNGKEVRNKWKKVSPSRIEKR